MKKYILITLSVCMYFCASAQNTAALDELIVKHYDSANVYYFDRQFEKSKAYAAQALEHSLKRVPLDSNMLANIYVRLSSLFNMSKDQQQALVYAHKVLNYAHDMVQRLKAYSNIAAVCEERRDIEALKSLYNFHLRLKNKPDYYYQHSLPFITNSLASFYFAMHDYRQALNLYLAIQPYVARFNTAAKLSYYHNLTVSYIYQNDFVQADRFRDKYANILSEEQPKMNHYFRTLLYRQRGLYYEKQGEYPQAIAQYQQAIAIHKKWNSQDPDLINYNYLLARIYLKTQEDDKALQHFQEALVVFMNGQFQDTNVMSNPKKITEGVNMWLLDILKHKAELLAKKHEGASSQIVFLEKSFETYDLLLQNLQYLLNYYVSDKDLSRMVKENKQISNQAIEVAYRLYKLKKDKKYIEKAFEFAEYSKQVGLQLQIKNKDILKKSGMSLQTMETILEYQQNISKYTLGIEQAETDEAKKSLRKKYYKELQKYNSYIRTLEQNYRPYYSMKYRYKNISVSEVQGKLSADEILIEYSLSDNLLYSFVIEKEGFEVYRTEIDDSFTNTLDNFIAAFEKKPTHFMKDNFYDYVNPGIMLYNYLIPSDLKKGKTLLIVPDSKLALIPFEALIEPSVGYYSGRRERYSGRDKRHGSNENNKNKDYDFRDFPYLIDSNAVGYMHSASLHFRDRKLYTTDTARSFLGMAPVFGWEDSDSAGLSLMFLYQTESEIQSMDTFLNKSFNFKTEVLLNDNATKRTFMEMYQGYDILHIATHGKVDKEQPMYSKLFFAQTSKNKEDNVLNLYEVWDMTLNSSLILLSACELNQGTVLEEGEGVLNFTRGFFYAGTRSLIISLWQAEDEMSKKIVQMFYEYLGKGYSKAVALQKAKKVYTKYAYGTKGHPALWAHLVLYGNNKSIDFGNKNLEVTSPNFAANIIESLEKSDFKKLHAEFTAQSQSSQTEFSFYKSKFMRDIYVGLSLGLLYYLFLHWFSKLIYKKLMKTAYYRHLVYMKKEEQKERIRAKAKAKAKRREAR